ncbi:hypothetical protein D3C78_1490910 [compost metagenome]
MLNACVVAVRAGAAGVYAFAVDQDQGVFGGHAADADIAAAATAGNNDARHVFQRIGNIAVGFVFNLLTWDDRNGRRGVLDFLLETGSGYHHGVLSVWLRSDGAGAGQCSNDQCG